jgi:hypothetical protein
MSYSLWHTKRDGAETVAMPVKNMRVSPLFLDRPQQQGMTAEKVDPVSIHGDWAAEGTT